MGAVDVGTSAETAVIVQWLRAEYAWLQQHHPGWTVVSHREILEGERLFDILAIESPDGEAREVYFDVSECFRHRRPPTPPCPCCGEPLVTAKSKQCGRCFTDFHNPAQVIHRKGRAHVEQVRAISAERRRSEARPPGLNDPLGTFNAQFSPRPVRHGVFVLHFPDRLSAQEERLFRIGIECLIAEGCQGVVCLVEESMRRIGTPTSEEREQISLLVTRILEFWRFGVRAVLVGCDELIDEMMRRMPVPISLVNCETEELAIIRLTERRWP